MKIFIIVLFYDILLSVIKSRRMRLAGYIASTGGGCSQRRELLGKPWA
jgi:hypothetical protein